MPDTDRSVFYPRGGRYVLRAVAVVALGSLGVSCARFAPPARSVDAGIAVPSRFPVESADSAAGDAGRADPGRWWETFGSAELTQLIERSLASNTTVAATAARLRQAEAVAGQAGSARYPSVDLGADADRRRARTTTGTETTTSTGDFFSLAAAAAYEVDLWGRVHAGVESADQATTAALGDLATAEMTLSAEVGLAWLQLVEQMAQEDLMREQLQTNRTYLELLEVRRRNGLAEALDVYQQEQIVHGTEARLAETAESVARLRNRIAVLAGGAPGSLDLGPDAALPELPPTPSTGLPAEVLVQRPDVAAAWARLLSADWDVAAARADRLPAIRLGAGASTDAGEVGDLFDNWAANLAAGLTAPLVDGGRRRLEVDRTRAVVLERVAQYREAVLTALQEVEDALAGESAQADRLAALERQLEAARNAHREAQSRYRKGAIDYLPVLTALSSTQALEREVLTARRGLLGNRVELHRALGGRWIERTEQAAVERASTEVE